MAANLFKTRYLINADGSESTTALTNANTAFIHTYLGDDSTGDGTREKPYRSATKANLKSGMTYILFRGVINEAINSTKNWIGDDINQMIVTSNFSTIIGVNSGIITGNYTMDNVYFNRNLVFLAKIISNGSANILNWVGNFKYCLFKKALFYNGSDNNDVFSNNTFFDLNLINFSRPAPNKNSIVFNNLNANPTVNCNIKNMVFPASCFFKYNSIPIIQPIWTNDSKANVVLLKTALINAGMSQINAEALIPKDSFGNETCLIVNETRIGGNHVSVFNAYAETLTGTLTSAITANQAKTSIQLTVADSSKFPLTGDIFIPNTAGNGFEVFSYTSVTINSGVLITFNGTSYTFKVAHSNGATCTRYGDVLDFTLNPDVRNEALWASDLGGFVGAFRPSVDGIINSGASIIDVDSNGADTVNAGDLILVNSSGSLVFNTSSAQIWNRFRDASCVEIPLGSIFKGLNGMSYDGSPFGTYLGKKQNLIDATALQPGDALTAGVLYKIFNDTSNDATKAILYNSVQYLPEFTFICLAGVTIFSLLNAGSGTYVKKVNADVLESIEILPYDAANTPSAFPKFSAPLMGECKLLYYTAAGATRYGKTLGQPVLFSDLAIANFVTDFPNCSDKISLYDGYAVSNADQEFYTLANAGLTSPKSTYFTAAIPILRFLRREVNAHFDLPYDY